MLNHSHFTGKEIESQGNLLKASKTQSASRQSMSRVHRLNHFVLLSLLAGV